MPEIKISELPKASYTKPSDKIMVVQGNTNKYIEFADFLRSMKSSKDIIFGGPAKLASSTAPAEDAGAVYPTNVIFQSETGTNLLYLETIGAGRVSINGTPTLPNAQFQIHGNVKIENLYLDSYELNVQTASSGTFPISLTTETSKLVAYGLTGSGKFSLGLGYPGQTKNLVYMGAVNQSEVLSITVLIDTVAVPEQLTAAFKQIVFSKKGHGATLKFVQGATGDGFWGVVGSYGASFS